MNRPIRIAINGFGRIGRTVLRQIMRGQGDSFEVVLINDLSPLETAAYLFCYDSTFGPYHGEVKTQSAALEIDGQSIPYKTKSDLRSLDLSGVDVVFECTGHAKTPDFASAGLHAGAANVLISAPSEAADRVIVLGANDDQLGDARIVSNASCTTNAIAPFLHALDSAFGINRAHVTTIHCYTSSQPAVDKPTASLERSRSAAVSIVPTTTSAASQTIHVLPRFEGRLSVAAVRVPTPSVSAIDAVLHLKQMPDLNRLKELFVAHPFIGVTEDPVVSSDMRARTESLILALPQTQIIQGEQLRLFGWYDNEWAYSARMLDLAQRMVERDSSTP